MWSGITRFGLEEGLDVSVFLLWLVVPLLLLGHACEIGLFQPIVWLFLLVGLVWSQTFSVQWGPWWLGVGLHCERSAWPLVVIGFGHKFAPHHVGFYCCPSTLPVWTSIGSEPPWYRSAFHLSVGNDELTNMPTMEQCTLQRSGPILFVLVNLRTFRSLLLLFVDFFIQLLFTSLLLLNNQYLPSSILQSCLYFYWCWYYCLISHLSCDQLCLLWHQCLGHLHSHHVSDMHNHAHGIPAVPLATTLDHCPVCAKAKLYKAACGCASSHWATCYFHGLSINFVF